MSEDDPVQTSTATSVVTSTTTSTSAVTTTATAATTTAATTVSSGAVGALPRSESRATVVTDAGRVEARYAGGVLTVEVHTDPGWSADEHRRGDRLVEVTWIAPGRSVHTTVTVDGGAISSSTRAESEAS